MSSSLQHLRNGTLVLLAICAVAVGGYMFAGWPFLDALYMSVITVFTVGYGETLPINTPTLQIFTMAFVVSGCTAYLYIGGALVQFLIEGQIETALGKRRMMKTIDDLTGHTIICGYGRVGTMLAADLQQANHPFVVVDENEELHQAMHADGILCVRGDATHEDALLAAGIERAKDIAVVLPNDAANVFITLSARNLNADLLIIARGVAPTTERKLLQAGADRVVLPEHIGAERIAGIILRPATSNLLTNAPKLGHLADELSELGLQLEEYSVPAGSGIVGRNLADLETKGSSAFLIVSIIRADGSVLDRPTLETPIAVSDTLVTLCHKGEVPEFTRLFQVRRAMHYRGGVID